MEEQLVLKMDDILRRLKVKGKVLRAVQNRHFAYYDIELELETGVRKLESKVREIALALKSKTVPTVTLVPEQGIVRLQMAMRDAEIIEFGQMSWSIKDKLMPFYLGETDEGKPLVVDFARNPHTLIAGGTGSGKSVLLHTIIGSMLSLVKCKARRIDAILCDPKGVEFSEYKGHEKSVVLHTYADIVEMLKLQVRNMNLIYNEMKADGIRSIEEEDPQKAYQTLIVIDEVADLMLMDKKLGVFEDLIIKLAQKSRAAGINLILATQRPSVDVITGMIKANFPARIACRTVSRVDSQVILDRAGAETLMGRGDAIISNMEHEMTRFQVAYSSPAINKALRVQAT